MAATTCPLEDISDMLDPKTNKHLHEVKRLLYVSLEQQVECSTSHVVSHSLGCPSR
jgi:hypothetical protein